MISRARGFAVRFLKTFGVWILITLPIVLAIRSSLFESFQIPTGSMIPTILIGDHVLVWKGAYRWKVPFTEHATDPVILKEREGPLRGDVIVFRYPRDMTVYYIKRVVGVSGDWVSIRNRQLLINDNPVETSEAPEETRKEVARKIGTTLPGEDVLKDFNLFEENLDGNRHLILQDRNQFVSERYGPVAIPPGHVFVLGDNRDFSNDSRFWGFVPLSHIEGKAALVWLQFHVATEPFRLDVSFRRFGQKL